MMFTPHYEISPPLLERIKQIAILTHDLNKRVLPEPVFAALEVEAAAVSTYASTSIEGNPLALTEVKRLLKNRPVRAAQSEREILNYNRALLNLRGDWKRASNAERPFDADQPLNAGQPLSSGRLLTIHREVMDSLLPDHQTGQFRREPVIIHDPRSREVTYLPPDHGDVPELVNNLLAFVAANRAELDAIILAGLFHKQMVVIHPFIDGNGRTTRLATKLLLAGLGIDIFNLFSFENYYNQNVTRYFQRVGAFGNYYDLADNLDFTPWLEYFAEGILDELRRVEKQMERNQASPDAALRPYHQIILDQIETRGYITDKMYAALTDRAKATRTLDFNKLIALGLIERQGRGPKTHYRRVA